MDHPTMKIFEAGRRNSVSHGLVLLALSLNATAGAQCPGITAAFTWNVQDTVLVFEDVTNTFMLPIDYRTWDFGDGDTAYGNDALHEFSASGVDTVTFSVGVAGCTYVASAFVAHGGPGDACAFEVAADFNTVQSANNTVEFANLSSGGGVGLVDLWHFGDGTISLDHEPSHTYLHPGTYEVGLNVAAYDSMLLNACVAGRTRWLHVDGNSSTCDTSLFVDLDYSVLDGQVEFEAVIVPLDDDLLVTYFEWDFGDGGTPLISVASPIHSYPYPGIYQICLTIYAYDSLTLDTCSARICRTVEVIAATGLQEPNEVSALLVWPVPFDDVLRLRGDVLRGMVDLSLLDPLGRLLRQQRVFAHGEIEWQLGELQPGCYMVRVNGPDGVVSSTVIKR